MAIKSNHAPYRNNLLAPAKEWDIRADERDRLLKTQNKPQRV